MVKTITALLGLALALPSAAVAQPATPLADQASRIWISGSNPSAIGAPRFIEGARMSPGIGRSSGTAPGAPQPPARSWAGRHPVALGAMIGAAGGAIWGGSLCWKQVCGDSQGPLLVALGTGLGVGIGTGVGVAISLSLGSR